MTGALSILFFYPVRKAVNRSLEVEAVLFHGLFFWFGVLICVKHLHPSSFNGTNLLLLYVQFTFEGYLCNQTGWEIAAKFVNTACSGLRSK